MGHEIFTIRSVWGATVTVSRASAEEFSGSVEVFIFVEVRLFAEILIFSSVKVSAPIIHFFTVVSKMQNVRVILRFAKVMFSLAIPFMGIKSDEADRS